MPQLATQKSRALLAYLIANRARNTSRDALVELLWPDSDVERARKSLNTALWSIRKALREGGLDPDEFLSAGKLAVRWTGDIWYDAEIFERERSRELYRGDFLEGDYEEWTVGERERLASIFEASLASSIASERSPDAARLLLARDPYDVQAYEVLIAHELTIGRPQSARGLLDRARSALSEISTDLVTRLEALFADRFANLRTAARDLRLPFAGRRRELESFERLLERGAPFEQIGIVGVAGSGKSMLLEQLIRRARDAGFHAIVADVPEDDPRTFGVWERLFEIRCNEPFVTFAETAGQAAAIALAERLAQTLDSSTMLVIDNVQFFHGDAYNVFALLARRARERGIPFVATARPEGRDRLRKALLPPSEEWELRPLTAGDLVEALEASVSGYRELAAALFTRSEGHPFFVARLLEFFIEQRALEFDGSRWIFDPERTNLAQFPQSLRAYIEERLRACGDDAVAVAAALSFDVEADADQLCAVMELDEARTLDALDDLLARGILATPDHGPQFAFSHDLIRETAQGLLAPARRVRLHRRFAEVIATSKERGAAARRARHLAAARQYVEAGEQFELAAFEAVQWHAFAEAERLVREAIDVLSHVTEGEPRERLLNVLKRLMSYLFLRKHGAESITYATEALEHGRILNDPKLQMFAYSSRAQAFGFARQDWRAMLQDVERLEYISRSLDAFAAVGMANIMRAHACFELGLLDEALTGCDAAHRIGIEHDRFDIAATAAQYKARFLAASHRFVEAFDSLEVARDAAERDGRIAQALWYFFAAFVGHLADRFTEAQTAAASAVAMAHDVTTERLRNTRLHTPPDQTQYVARAILIDIACVEGRMEDAARDAALLARLPYAQLNNETRSVTAMLLARCGAEIEPGVLQAAKPFDVWHFAREPWMEDSQCTARAIAQLCALEARSPADADRVLGDLGKRAAAAGDVISARAAAQAAGRLRASRSAGIAALGTRPLPI